MALAGRKRKQQDLARDDSVELRGGLQKTVADVGSANGTSNGNGEGSSNVNGTDSDSKDEWTTVTGGGGSALGASGRKKPKKEKVRPAAGASVDLAAPLFQFDPAGFRNKSSIQVNDVRDLILNLLAKNSHPKWLNIKNKNAIRGVVCVLIQGIEPPTLGLPSTSTLSDNLPQSLLPGLPKSSLPLFQKLFSHYCPTRAPGDRIKLHSVVQALLNAPIPAGDKQKRDQSRQKANSAFKSGGASGGEAAVAPDPAQYLLDPESFSENGYIVPSYGFDIAERRIRDPKGKSPAKLDRVTVRPFEEWQRDDGCIETPQLEHEDADADRPLLRILGIDCEMCVTTAGSEVCRISVVDGIGKCIYNTLVKPTNTVTDYATVYSGITEELLAPVTTRLEDVQRRLSELIDYDTALVGHSLNCDLVVLKLAHPWVIDTSVIYQHTRGPPFKASLKWLAQKWLNKEIQKPTKISTASSGKGETTEIIGHNSEEDARAAVELVNLKMQKGPHFGEFANDQESIFERLARDGNANFPESSSNGRKRSCIVDHGNPGQWHGAKANTAVACRTDDEVAKGVAENAEGHDFVFARLMDLSHTLGWSQPSNSVLGKTTAAQKGTSVVPAADVEAPKAEATDADIAQAYARLNEHLGAIHASLPLNTAFVVMSGHNDPRAVLALSQKRSKFDVLYRTGKPLSQMDKAELWTEEDDRNLASEVAKVREGMTFLSIRR